MELAITKNNLASYVHITATQWQSRTPALRDGLQEFVDAVPRIMHWGYSVAVLGWYTLVGAAALAGYLVLSVVQLLRWGYQLGTEARGSRFVGRLKRGFRKVPSANQLATLLHFAKDLALSAVAQALLIPTHLELIAVLLINRCLGWVFEKDGNQ